MNNGRLRCTDAYVFPTQAIEKILGNWPGNLQTWYDSVLDGSEVKECTGLHDLASHAEVESVRGITTLNITSAIFVLRYLLTVCE